MVEGAKTEPRWLAPELQAAHGRFRTEYYMRHNARRLEHLVSLGLDLRDRSVLELGAGIGDHTTFFLDRGCTVLAVEARAENCEVFKAVMKRHIKFGYKNAVRCTLSQGDNAKVDTSIPDAFDIVYCYGLLYHVRDPATALKTMAQKCSDLLLLETCVLYGDHEAVNAVAEVQADFTQSFEGDACRPTRPWIFNRLRELFAYAYIPRTQPAHEEFPLDWRGPQPKFPDLTRSVFVASRRPLDNPNLLDHVPQQQSRL